MSKILAFSGNSILSLGGQLASTIPKRDQVAVGNAIFSRIKYLAHSTTRLKIALP